MFFWFEDRHETIGPRDRRFFERRMENAEWRIETLNVEIRTLNFELSLTQAP
jgi:hypothetical protein